MMLVQHEKDLVKEKKVALANGQQTIGDFE